MIFVSGMGERKDWVKCSCRLPYLLRVGFQVAAAYNHSMVSTWVEAMAWAVVAHYERRGLVFDDTGKLTKFCRVIGICASDELPTPAPARGQHLSPELPASVWALVRADAENQCQQINTVLLGICTDYLIGVGLYPEKYRMPLPEREPIAA